MYYLDFAYKYFDKLARLLFKASTQEKNTWYFQNHDLIIEKELEHDANTCAYERQIIAKNDSILGYISAEWKRPVDIIDNFRVINFTNSNSIYLIKGVLGFIDYLFMERGCKVINFSIPEKSDYLKKITKHFIMNFMGHQIGLKHYSIISYSGIISDEILCEITYEDYFNWKNKNETN